MATEKNILSRKITELPAWSVLILILIMGVPGAASFLNTGILGANPSHLTESQILQKVEIDQLKKGQEGLIRVSEKNAELLNEIVLNSKLNLARIDQLEKQIDELRKEIKRSK